MDQLEFYPGPSPQDETVISGQASFVEVCKAHIARDAEQFGWRLGNSIVTRSKDGCLVWRADFRSGTSLTGGLLAATGSDDVALAVLFSQPLDKLK